MSPTADVTEIVADIERMGVTNRVLREVGQERFAQDKKWGEQNHPMIGGMFPEANRREYAESAAYWKDCNDYRIGARSLGFDGILLEEVFEALEEEDPAKMRVELLQVAAVAVGMVEALDRAQNRAKA